VRAAAGQEAGDCAGAPQALFAGFDFVDESGQIEKLCLSGAERANAAVLTLESSDAVVLGEFSVIFCTGESGTPRRCGRRRLYRAAA
jgi:hypothetical protein